MQAGLFYSARFSETHEFIAFSYLTQFTRSSSRELDRFVRSGRRHHKKHWELLHSDSGMDTDKPVIGGRRSVTTDADDTLAAPTGELLKWGSNCV
jgi:hypothetical protein